MFCSLFSLSFVIVSIRINSSFISSWSRYNSHTKLLALTLRQTRSAGGHRPGHGVVHAADRGGSHRHLRAGPDRGNLRQRGRQIPGVPVLL